jgi:bifunctional DNase/RNase
MYMQQDNETTPDLNFPIILLLDEANGRVLPIWVGPHEGQLIQMNLNHSAFPRPMTWNFVSNILDAVGAQVESVIVSKLVNETFYAITRLRFGDAVHDVDSRPSDAIGLALNTSSPIFVAEDVMNSTGIPMGEQFKASLAERKRMSRLSSEELVKLFPPPPPSAEVKMPTQEELEAAGKEAEQKMKAIIGQ